LPSESSLSMIPIDEDQSDVIFAGDLCRVLCDCICLFYCNKFL